MQACRAYPKPPLAEASRPVPQKITPRQPWCCLRGVFEQGCRPLARHVAKGASRQLLHCSSLDWPAHSRAQVYLAWVRSKGGDNAITQDLMRAERFGVRDMVGGQGFM
jgi:hypothetical protein